MPVKRPRKVKASKSKPLTIKAVRAKGYSPAYEKRLIRGIRKARKSGKKPTRQSARGHKPKEHIIRKEREAEANGGLTSREVGVIIKWYNEKFNPGAYKEIPTEDDVIEYGKERGYQAFKEYQKIWNAARDKYLAELEDGSYIQQDFGYLVNLATLAKVRPTGDEQWLYYH